MQNKSKEVSFEEKQKLITEKPSHPHLANVWKWANGRFDKSQFVNKLNILATFFKRGRIMFE